MILPAYRTVKVDRPGPNEGFAKGARNPCAFWVQSGRHLLIDGHNILHSWENSRALTGKSTESARSQVVLAGVLIHDVEHLRVSVVFDGRGDEIGIEHPGRDDGYLVFYAPASMTADDLIEQMVGSSDRPQDCIVATGDRMERETVEALGAECVSPAYLKEWVERCRKRQSAEVRRRLENQDKDWHNSLPL